MSSLRASRVARKLDAASTIGPVIAVTKIVTATIVSTNVNPFLCFGVIMAME